MTRTASPPGPDQWPEFADRITLDRVRVGSSARFLGESNQMPPPFSAKKIAGTPAYKLAREGKPVELKPAKVRIDAFDDSTNSPGPKPASPSTISSGGYVRSVAHAIGCELGCGAHLSQLAPHACGSIFA